MSADDQAAMRHTASGMGALLPVTDRLGLSLVTAMLLIVVMAGLGRGVGAAGTATAVSHGPRTDRVIALTFDDGVSPANCRRILAELVDRGVPATFFPMAEALPLDPAFWRLVADAGDPIGDHTVTHPHMPALTYAAQLRQMTSSRVAIERTIGRPMLDVFRPPYGEYNGTTLAAAAAAGFPTVLTWDTSDRDTSPTDTVAVMLAAAERGQDGSVVLMHCGPNETPYVLPNLIDYYVRHGFRLVTVPELLGVTWEPGATASLNRDEILDGVSPLPSHPSGGPVVGFSGGLPTTSSSFVPSPSGSARPIPDGSGGPGSSEAGVAASSPPASAVPAAASGRPLPIPSPGDGSDGAGVGTPTAEQIAIAGLAILALLATAGLVVLQRGRR